MAIDCQHSNIILIGMAGSGKSTLGRLLAERWGWEFVDVDPLIVARHGKSLAELQDEMGRDGFVRLEAETIRSLAGTKQIIAPGGSVVYDEGAMAHLRALGTVVYLNASETDIERHIGDLRARGVVIAPGQTVVDLQRRRHPLYLNSAHRMVRVEGDDPSASAAALAETLEAAPLE